jgi:hypothetical protein
MSNRIELTDEQLETLAERAADKVLKKVYEEVGRSTVRLGLWVLGLAVTGLLAYLGLTGKLK